MIAPALLGLSGGTAAPAIPVVEANQNRSPAGRLRGNVLTIRLVVQMARWYPQGKNGPSIDVETFAEEGRSPTVPGPLIRVPVGTVIEASIRNALPDSSVTVHGLYTRPATAPDSIRLAPGQTRSLRFFAGEPGTYMYRGFVWKYRERPGPPTPDIHEREQLAGAFVIDSAGSRADDRIFVINIWGDWKDSADYRNALAINGMSWPHTERIRTSVGDTLRWRVINATARNHPMHLHGFYYRIDAHGDIARDTLYREDQRRLVATEMLRPAQTMSMTWSPDRPGNWLFHCHLGLHVVPEARLDAPPHRHGSNYAHDPDQHMAGLVLGIVVDPGRRWQPVSEPAARPLRLMVQEGWRRGRAARSMAFVLQRQHAPARDSIELPSSALLLTRGEPADITVVNGLAEPIGVHWHGIELESYSDGVVGWSGMGKKIAPLIAPRDSFVAHLTLPRAGTFIYHTHLNDLEQLTSGLYGAIVVLEPGEVFDPRTDHVYLVGWDGVDQPPHLLLNGDSSPPPAEMAFGATHRLRFINIGVAGLVRFALQRDTTIVTWRARAKDGADLPSSQATMRRAVQHVMVGETYDFDFRPPDRGVYTLIIEGPGGPRASRHRQRIEVR
ncbi:MAG TPA: multicopper oxidase domain-containing protein [Gemmatimonadaceae bacterium]|nr:multicopper oxidase domain-containing protein [Gemmatimonadaceae bacterium]